MSTSVGAEGVDSLGTTGLIVTDDPRSFAEAVASLLTDRSAWERQRNELLQWSARGQGTSVGTVVAFDRASRSVNYSEAWFDSDCLISKE